MLDFKLMYLFVFATILSVIPESHLIVWDASTGEIVAEIEREVVSP